jgi:solute carrier family 45 protein 1/2/4
LAYVLPVTNGFSSKESEKQQSVTQIVSQTLTHIFHVPDRIQAICWVQFWSWIGWFPVLFYSSTWVGEIYLRFEAPSTNHDDALNDVGRHGSMSLIVFSSVATFASIVIPWFIQSPGDDRPTYTARPPSSLEHVLGKIRWRKPTLLATWAFGNILFASTMIWAPLVQSVWFATLLLAVLGIPNAIGGLAATTFLGVEINRMSSAIPLSHSRGSSHGRRSDSIELDGTNSPPRTLHLRHESTGSVTSSSTGELSGIYLGILNIYTTLPQFVGTAISWIVFSILEPGKSPELAKDAHPDEHHSVEGLSGIGVCLFSKLVH